MAPRAMIARKGRPLRRRSIVSDSPMALAIITAAADDLRQGRRAEAAARLVPLPLTDVTVPTARRIAALLMEAGAGTRALACFDHVLIMTPDDIETMTGRARLLSALGCRDEALAAYAIIAPPESRDADLHFERASLLQASGDLAGAIEGFDAALRLRPAFPAALRAAGGVLRDNGHPEQALAFFAEAVRHAPDDRDALLDWTNLLQGLDRFEEAIAAYDAVLARAPKRADLLTNKGIALQELGHLPAARAAYEAAVAADPTLAQGHLNLANALVWSGEAAKALASARAALALRPHYPEALCASGVALRSLGRLDEARTALDAAIAARPDFPHARTNRGELALLRGAFAEGWPDYAERFRSGRQTRPRLPKPVPEWTGGPIVPGSRIAVLADQGNGDMIQFARYLPLLATRGHAVTFLCPARLHRLLAPVTRAVRVVSSVGDDETFDHEVTLSGLPQAFGTDLATIPASPFYLSAEPALIARWRDRIGAQGLRIGLCWRGDQRWQGDPQRSVPLDAVAPLASVPGIRLFSLQLPANTGGDEALFETLGIDSLGAELDRGGDSFCDTAAAMESLDGIVTCDTSIAHLAGALGRPVFVVLRAFPEWRWLLNRTDSPWYPSMRLFRQTTAGDWSGPIAAVVAALTEQAMPYRSAASHKSPPISSDDRGER